MKIARRFLVVFILACFTLLAGAQEKSVKDELFLSVDNYADVIAQLSDAIWGFAEIELQETQSAAALADELEKQGFVVERGVAGLPTAFTATFGSGFPRIGILAEFDALPGLSQAKGIAEKSALVAGDPGHGCGHNIYGAACLGAVVALKQAMESHNIPGTIVFYGCPAEETVVGKTVMAKAGLFNDLDAAITWHPGQENRVSLQSTLAINSFEVTFHGKTAHGAADPWNGRSALDALEMFHFGINMLREHVKPTVRMHYIVKDGGKAPNVVPDYTRGWYFVRDVDRAGVKHVYERILKIAEGAALATETTVEVKLLTGVHRMLVNETIANAHFKNMELAGAPPFTEEEQEFGKELQRLFGADETGLYTNIIGPSVPDKLGGSTDVAEVSWIVPTAQFGVACAPDNTPWHSWVVVSTCGTSIGHKAAVVAAKTLAATGYDLLTDKALLEQSKKEFAEKTEGKEYVSPYDELKISGKEQ